MVGQFMRVAFHPRVALVATVVAISVASLHVAWGADAVRTRYVVGVSGMICPTSCTHNVREALKTLPEVEDVAIDFEAKTATITTRGAQVLTREQVHKALMNSGFGVTSFESQPARDGDG